MITSTDNVQLKCDCVDGSIVNDIQERISFSFNLSALPGYEIIKELNIFFCLKKYTKHDWIMSNFSYRTPTIPQLISTPKH